MVPPLWYGNPELEIMSEAGLIVSGPFLQTVSPVAPTTQDQQLVHDP